MLSLSSHIWFIKIYVDDMNQGCRIIPYGSIYESGKIYIPSIGWRGRAGRGENLTDERKIQIERESEQMAKEEVDIKTIEQYSAMIYRKIANDCRPKSVVMVEDTPHNHTSGWLPVLDTQMCVKQGKFSFKHYAKPMASLELIQSRSALSRSAKLDILV